MTMQVKYLGELECESKHLDAGATIFTGAPVDNQGKGNLFSPTDLVACAVAQCALITLAIAGKERNLNLQDASCQVKKVMSTDKPRRIIEIACDFTFNGDYSDADKKFIERVVHICPVVNSLSPEIKKNFSFSYKL